MCVCKCITVEKFGDKGTDSYPENFLQEWLHGLRRPFLSNVVENS